MAKDINSKEIESLPKPKRGFWGFLWLPTALILALAAGSLTGVLASYYLNNSRASVEVSALATYRPPQVTKIFANDGETVLAEFAIEKRIPVKEKDIPKQVKDALIAVEDMRFYNHIGIDPYRLAGAVVKNVTTGSKEGASTLTQQLAKNLFLYKDQTFTRKFNEWVMALEIERFYTKEQILEMYMNYVFLGAGSYGFEAGARTYFNKTLKDLTLEEAALLAAIPKSPTEYSPTRNMKGAEERRNIVLDQMVKYGSISQSEADQAKSKPVQLADTAYYQSQPKSSASDYPIEEVRKYLEEKYTTRVAQGGLQVYTTIDPNAQEYARKAVRERLRSYDRGRGEWRSEYKNIFLDEKGEPLLDEKNEPLSEAQKKQRLNSFKHADWYGDEYTKDEYIKGLVVNIDEANDTAEIRFGKYKAIISSKEMGRSKVKSPKQELKVGNICEFFVNEVDEENQTLKVTLEQVPEVQASIVCINAKNGEIVAMIGGYDFQTNKFNNATQGLRQTGSAFKPFVYTAAVEWGITPDMTVSGAPIRRGGWMPHNYDGSYSHPNVPMKTALAKSYNLAAVHLLDQVGIQTGSQMVRRFGITNPMAPVLPSALGASEVSLLEMVSAYTAFPNKGVRVEPHLIRKVLDRDGKVLEEWEKTTYTVTTEYVASSMTKMMRGVVQGGGTATNASAGGHPLAGKTGTVNNQTDVWFIGFTPTYVTGVWMGNPLRKESLGAGMTGGHGAVPYFNGFMVPFMKDKPRDNFSEPPPMPPEIKRLNELRKREEVEKLEKADAEGRRLGVSFSTGSRRSSGSSSGSRNGSSSSGGNQGGGITKIQSDSNTSDLPSSTRNTGSSDDGPIMKPSDSKKPSDNSKKPDAPPPSEPPKKKGKKGDDEP
ncbi:MAG: PBP1A family penicillin-binding protein [Pyrinomonadaceae bacterium]|nr:PBP1A family penicillin-binding protein [Pyrinomonadaceae bacterium]